MKFLLKSIVSTLALLVLLPSVSLANGRHHHGGHVNIRSFGHHSGHVNIRSFGHHDMNHWRGGAWHHGHHGGRLGWWWVVGSTYYLYPQAIYPYPYQPSAVFVEPQPAQAYVAPPSTSPQEAPVTAASTWYFCDASQTYYPYVASCSSGWRAVPATPQGAPQ